MTVYPCFICKALPSRVVCGPYCSSYSSEASYSLISFRCPNACTFGSPRPSLREAVAEWNSKNEPALQEVCL